MKEYLVRVKFPNSNDVFVSQVQLDLPPVDLTISSLIDEGVLDSIKLAAIEFKKGFTADDFEILEVKAVDDYAPYNINVVSPDGYEHTLFNIQFDTSKDPELHRREILESIVEGTSWTVEELNVRYFGPAPQQQFVGTPTIMPTIAEQVAIVENQETGARATESAAIIEKYGDNIEIDYDIINLANELLAQEQTSTNNG